MVQNYTGLALAPEWGEGHITILPSFRSYTTAGRWIETASTAYPMYTLVYNASNTQNDQIDFWVWLSKGTYTLSWMGETNTNYAIGTISLDGTSVGTIDWYGSLVRGVLKTLTSISVTQSKRYILSIKAATRNASNTTGWYLCIHSLALFRTA